MHEEVLRLRKESLTYQEIVAELEKKFRVKLSKATISTWCRGLSTPARSGHIFIPKPTPELAYVIGVETGDAFLNVKLKSYQYRIRLRAVDREFVEAFNQAVSRVLGCPPHRLWKGVTEKETHVEFGSYLLHKFLLQPLEALKPFIEHNQRCVAAFLKGFFDSEGSVEVRGIVSASNTDLALLRYVQFLLSKYMGISTRGPYLGTRKGSVLTRRGKSYRRNSDCYSIAINKSLLRKFQEEIGMTIDRKRRRIERILAMQGSRFKNRGSRSIT
jgi:intein-encoded DNA endonuclease-like protein